jgi:hypothetical protein
LTILLALKKWRHYLSGGPLIIKIDQQSLKYMISHRLTDGIQHKLLLKLLEYDYTLEYKKGAENRVANALSRQERVALAMTTTTPTWIEDVESSHKDDTHLKAIIEQLTIKDHSVQHYTIHSGILRYKGRLCIGTSTYLRSRILSALHSSSIGGHSGIKGTYHRIKRIFYWPNLNKAVETFVAECPVCQRAKGEHCHYPSLLAPLPIPQLAWIYISVDFVEGLPKSGGENVILVVVDRLTKYAHFIALTHPFTSQTVAQLFIDNVIKLHDTPVAIVTDRDMVFTSRLWQDIFKSLKTTLQYNSAHHPQTDGQPKRVNQYLENYLRCMVFLEPKKWSTWLSLVGWWYNTNYHTSLKSTPFEALCGFPPPLISEVMIPGLE